MPLPQNVFVTILLLSMGVADWSPVQAQQFTVQQPVWRQFTAGTTVSVPDRGRAFMGGVSRAASGRVTSGPFRSSSGLGFESENSSVSAHVWIHDFEELDRQTLEAEDGGRVRRVNRKPPLPGVADHAWRTLQGMPAAPQKNFSRRFARR
jgi:hypothetical protein